MSLKNITLQLFILFTAGILGQPRLDIQPNRVEFEDLFNRIDETYLINDGDALLSIDSIDYDESLYLLSFENNQQIPFTIQPDDSVKMSVALVGFFYVNSADTADTIWVYNNGEESPEDLRVRINFFEDDYGMINGTVSDNLIPLDSTFIYFFYYGIYLIDTVMTSSSGQFEILLPEGEYTIAAERNGYYVLFHDSTYDPFFADLVEIDEDDTLTIDFNLRRITDFTKSVSGQVYDSSNGTVLDKGIIIVRRGTHVPAPLPKGESIQAATINAFAGFIKPDGSYNVYLEAESFYFIQAQTNYFLPGYYNDEGVASVYWQNADSVLIGTNVIDKNVFLISDSSIGNGSIGGSINFAAFSNQINYEGITLLARNLSTNALYSYNFGKEEADYNIRNIPFGTYEIVAQKIGFQNAFSQIVTIDPFNNQFSGVDITFLVSDVSSEQQIPDNIVLYQNYPNPFNPT
ncbi:MAG TPA: carboxypeptidase-like regulatory domain-containing protein, partial [Ignavibacteriaceae bacterium]